jgi:tetratricopeptide (TPR) repeat protein
VQIAYVLVDHDPERALTLLDKAGPLMRAEDATLRWLAATLRTEGLIESGQVARALLAFQRTESLREAQPRPDASLRSTFTAARLLEALGRSQEAERLFEEVIAGDLGHENYHVAILDFLYLFGFHVRAGASEKAVEVSRRALAQLERLELGHDQLRVAWEQLGDAARRQALGSQALNAARDYLWIYWKHPAPEAPVFAQQEGPHKTFVPVAELTKTKAVEALLARAAWCEIRALPRRAQQDRVAQSPACRSRAFLQVVLADLRSARTQAETEFLASLAISAIRGMDSKQYPVPLKNDFLAGVWIEVANTRRIATDWHHAAAALRKAEQYLAGGKGNSHPKARALSIAASLGAEQGQLSEAMALLERCHQIYETSKDWHLAAHTLVQMAYVLVDSEPERALTLIDKADPLIPADDAALRWLAATLRTEGLIESGQIVPALLAFQWAESLRAAQTRPDASLRSTFTAARLLELQGRAQEAEMLFEEVICRRLGPRELPCCLSRFSLFVRFSHPRGLAREGCRGQPACTRSARVARAQSRPTPRCLGATEGCRGAAGADQPNSRAGPELPSGLLEKPCAEGARPQLQIGQVGTAMSEPRAGPMGGWA